MTESCFPQMLGLVSEAKRQDKRWMAALYIACRMAPGPLTITDAEACMTDSDEEILFALGKAAAQKIGRNPEEVTNVVWKTTRAIGLHRGPLATSGKFVVLTRNIYNVFESQSRFEHGISNRKPLRYALFAQSYIYALAKCPKERTFELSYDALPEVIPTLLEFMGVSDSGEWQTGTSTLDIVSANCSWLTQINDKFTNTDPEKRARLDPEVKKVLTVALAITRLLRPFMGPIRRYFDMRSIAHVNSIATKLVAAGKSLDDLEVL